MNYPVRPIASAHWPGALELLTSVFVGEGFSSPESGARAFQQALLESAGKVLIATGDTDVLGVVLLLRNASPLAQIARDDEAEIRMLAVSPRARGKGIGESLVRACIEHAAAPIYAAHTIVLCTQPTMTAAQRLYARTGFVRRTDRDFTTVRPANYSPDHGSLERLFYSRPL